MFSLYKCDGQRTSFQTVVSGAGFLSKSIFIFTRCSQQLQVKFWDAAAAGGAVCPQVSERLKEPPGNHHCRCKYVRQKPTWRTPNICLHTNVIIYMLCMFSSCKFIKSHTEKFCSQLLHGKENIMFLTNFSKG